jgi:hypothetical protein
MKAKSRASSALPSFGVWQAHQLLARDLLFGTFLLLTFCLYLFKTAPAACSIGPEPDPAAAAGSNHTSTAASQQHWTPVWRFFCRRPFASPLCSFSLTQPSAACQQAPTAACQRAGAAAATCIAAKPSDLLQQHQPDSSFGAGAWGWMLLAAGALQWIIKGLVTRLVVKCTGFALCCLQVSSA